METADGHLSIRINSCTGQSIDSGKMKLLEEIRSGESISEAARLIGMSRGRACSLVDEINRSLREPAVTAGAGGAGGGGAIVTPVGERVIGLYHAIELRARTAVGAELRAIEKLIRHD
jgi:molybdate transport system regulatory protein